MDWLAATIVATASGTMDEQSLAAWFRARLTSLPRQRNQARKRKSRWRKFDSHCRYNGVVHRDSARGCEILIDSHRRVPALANRPHDERSATPQIARREHAVDASHVTRNSSHGTSR